MRRISETDYAVALKKALVAANFTLREDVRRYFDKLYDMTSHPDHRSVVEVYCENASIACRENRALCQDTGYVELFVRLGREACVDFDLRTVTDQCVAEVYETFRLRMSLAHPVTRENTLDNTPAFIDLEPSEGDKLRVDVLLKGGGSENAAKTGMLLPTASENEIVAWVVDHIRALGAKACPPYLLGVGIGGTLAKSAYAAKRLLLEPVGSVSRDPLESRIEEKIFREVNRLPIGFQGLKFGETAMSVRVKTIPCHIATLPVSVAVGCNSARQASFEV